MKLTVITAMCYLLGCEDLAGEYLQLQGSLLTKPYSTLLATSYCMLTERVRQGEVDGFTRRVHYCKFVNE